jgi:hypothetical protein
MTIPVFTPKHIWLAGSAAQRLMGLPQLRPALAKICLSSDYDA